MKTKRSTRKHYLPKLSRYLELVSYGIRTAYLVDCCQTSVEELREVLGGSSRDKVVIVVLADDFVVVNKALLRQMLDSLSVSAVKDDSYAIACLNVEQTFDEVGHFQRVRIAEFLHTLFDQNLDRVDVLTINDCGVFSEEFGLSFVAGWLLGYPCIYNRLNHSSDSVTHSPGHVISGMISLKKYSVRLLKQGSNPASFKYESDGSVDIMEFTVPLEHDFTEKVLSLVEGRVVEIVSRCSAAAAVHFPGWTVACAIETVQTANLIL